jgi:hypothetical protein
MPLNASEPVEVWPGDAEEYPDNWPDDLELGNPVG